MAENLAARGGAAEPKRRDFLTLTIGALGALGLASAVWPLVDSLNPAADQRNRTYFDRIQLPDFDEGERLNFMVPGLGLVFVSHRTAAEIAAAKAGDMADLKDPELDSARVRRDDWLVVLAACTYRGCWIGGQSRDAIYWGRDQVMIEPLKLDRGTFGGWACSCCASEYDTSGRVRRGPAPRNLVVPNYSLATDGMLKISWQRS